MHLYVNRTLIQKQLNVDNLNQGFFKKNDRAHRAFLIFYIQIHQEIIKTIQLHILLKNLKINSILLIEFCKFYSYLWNESNVI